MLKVALWLAISGLVTIAGAVVLVVGLVTATPGSGAWWGYMSIAYATLFAGAIWLFSSWCVHSRLIGAESPTVRPGWFWLDTLEAAYGVLGLLMVLAVPLMGLEKYWPALGLGGVTIIVSAMWLTWRSPMWRAVPKTPSGMGDTLDRRLLVMAFGMIVLTLMVIGGVAEMTFGLLFQTPGTREFWGNILSSLGLLVGGGGGLFGLRKGYRLMVAESDRGNEKK